MSRRLEAALPFWLDRPDEEALDIALEVRRAGIDALWIGELVTFDAFALATAVGVRVPGVRLKIGPLAIGVRTPVAVALGASSVASLIGGDVDVALGASSPAIVSAWHDREWAHSASWMRETIECLRRILAGEPSNFEGRYVRSRGFRLRRRHPDTNIVAAAFGPAMTRVAARHSDEVVLNLVPPERVRAVRETIDAEAAAAGRTPPRLAVWLPVALEPGDAALAQMASQLTIYLAPPGYGRCSASSASPSWCARRAAARGAPTWPAPSPSSCSSTSVLWAPARASLLASTRTTPSARTPWPWSLPRPRTRAEQPHCGPSPRAFGCQRGPSPQALIRVAGQSLTRPALPISCVNCARWGA